MNWDFFAHIVRDVFPHPIRPIIYGNDTRCLEIFHSSLHGLGFHMLYSGDPTDMRVPHSHHWNITDAIQILGDNHCDFFVSIKEDTMFPIGGWGSTAGHLHFFMQKNGLVFLVNPDQWADGLSLEFKLREDYIEEVKKYSMFRDERVLIYEKV